MDLDFYKKQAILKQKEHKKFLDGLKKKPPKMRLRKPLNGFIRESQYRLLLNEARGDKIGGGEAAYKAG